MQKRSIASLIILSIVTCGIYSLYWIASVSNDIEATLGEKSDGACRSGGLVILFSFLTCGIYTLYWFYKEGQRLEFICSDKGVRRGNEPWLYLVLDIFGLGIVSMALMQDDINRIADAL